MQFAVSRPLLNSQMLERYIGILGVDWGLM